MCVCWKSERANTAAFIYFVRLLLFSSSSSSSLHASSNQERWLCIQRQRVYGKSQHHHRTSQAANQRKRTSERERTTNIGFTNDDDDAIAIDTTIIHAHMYITYVHTFSTSLCSYVHSMHNKMLFFFFFFSYQLVYDFKRERVRERERWWWSRYTVNRSHYMYRGLLAIVERIFMKKRNRRQTRAENGFKYFDFESVFVCWACVAAAAAAIQLSFVQFLFHQTGAVLSRVLIEKTKT